MSTESLIKKYAEIAEQSLRLNIPYVLDNLAKNLCHTLSDRLLYDSVMAVINDKIIEHYATN